MREISPQNYRHLPERTTPESELSYVYSPADDEPGVRDYWTMLLRHRRLVCLLFLMAVGLGVFITARATLLYTASTTLKIEPQNTMVSGLGDATARDENYFQTQVALLKSRALAAKVISQLGLESNPSFRDPTPGLADQLRSRVMGYIQSFVRYVSDLFASPPIQVEETKSSLKTGSELGVRSSLINRYLRFLEVSPMVNTNLVRVSFTTPDPHLSRELATTHATAFIRMTLETRFELTNEARDYLETKISEVKAKVQQSEEAFNRFLQKHGVVSLEGGQNIVVERMVDLNRRLTEARAKRIELESLYRTVKNKNAQYLAEIMNNQSTQKLKASLDTLQVEEARLSTVFKPDHPRLQELNQQIAQARQRLNAEIATIVRGVEADYNAARAREAALQAEAEQQQQAALNLKELGVEYTVLQGAVEANRTVYTNLLKRLTETSISNDSPLSNLIVADAAETPLGPSSPRIEFNLMVASALGLFLGLGLAFLLEHLNSTMRTPQEVWRAVAVPTIGVVPHLKRLRGSPYANGTQRLASLKADASPPLSRDLIATHHPFSLVSEFYRSTRTSILLSQAEKPLRVVLLTSASPQEGKTVTTLNLAITLAQSGRKVIVLDADLRKGNCHTLLGLYNHRGLTSVLTGKLPLEECIQPTAVPGLSLVARGPMVHNPAELLGSSDMVQMLSVLRERFDLVLIDAPPAIAVADAAVLSVQCDGVLLVLRANKTTSTAARRLIEVLETVGAPILGIVLNAFDIRNPEYAEYRQYYKSYYGVVGKDTKKQG